MPVIAALVRRWRTFARRYGWRAYALPILMAVTAVTIVEGNPVSAHHRAPVATSARHSLDVEGLGSNDQGSSAAAFRRGSTPRPVVISLTTDERTCAQNTYARRVIVDIHTQHLWACSAHRQVLQTAVTTGASAHGDATPTGSWQVEGRQRNRYLVGPGYRDYVHYWVPFSGDFGLHDAPWEKTGYGSQDYRTRGSHGCVHLPRSAMAWLYHWVTVGSTVVTIED